MPTPETKWTPGPWHVEGNASSTIAARHDGRAEISEACATGDMTYEEMRANAALIAAAPELYEALDTFMRLGTMDDQSAIDAARSALAHARGEVR